VAARWRNPSGDEPGVCASGPGGRLVFELTFWVNFLPGPKVLHKSGYGLLAQTFPRLGLFRGHPEKVLAGFRKFMN